MIEKFNFNFNKKKYLLVVIFLVLALVSTFKFDTFASANNNDNAYDELQSGIDSVVDNFDFSDVQNLVDDLDDFDFFNEDIKVKIKKIINGEYFSDYSTLFTGLITLVLGDIREVLPVVFVLVAISLLSSILLNMKSVGNKGISDIIFFACFSVSILVILISMRSIMNVTNNTLNLISNQMEVIFPLLITMLTAIGSLSTVSIYNPLVAIITGIISIIFNKFLYPIFILIFLLTVVGNLTETVKLDKLTNFLSSGFKWVIGIVFTIFAGFLTMQGISAGKFDSISIKATKFAIKSYIPIIGGYISDGMDFIVLGSVLVKNTVGLIGVIILFFTIISPIINIVIYKLCLQLSAGIIEMTGNNRMSNFIFKCSKILTLPIVIILGIALMYVIMIALIMCTANIF